MAFPARCLDRIGARRAKLNLPLTRTSSTYVALLLAGVLSSVPAGARATHVDDESQARSDVVSYPVAAEFADVEPFIRAVEDAGLLVQYLEPSDLNEWFQGIRRAVLVTTDLGQIEMALFPRPQDIERLAITYRVTKDARAPNRYEISGWPLNLQTRVTETAEPLYVTLARNWFIVTSEPAVDRVLKRRFGFAPPGG